MTKLYALIFRLIWINSYVYYVYVDTEGEEVSDAAHKLYTLLK